MLFARCRRCLIWRNESAIGMVLCRGNRLCNTLLGRNIDLLSGVVARRIALSLLGVVGCSGWGVCARG